MESLLEELKKLCGKGGATGIPDGEDVNDWAGGNIDDAYWLGFEHGQNSTAEAVIDLIKEFETGK